MAYIRMKDTWMTPYALYLSDAILSTDAEAAKTIRWNARQYTLVDGHLLRTDYIHPLLTCVDEEQANRILSEVHNDTCGSHIGKRGFSLKIVLVGYYWPTMKADSDLYVKRCEQCQKHAEWHYVPAEDLHCISRPWPFHTWGINILGSFPQAARQLKYLIVAVEYFKKWIEAGPVAMITVQKVRSFIWRNIVCCFGIPRQIISYHMAANRWKRSATNSAFGRFFLRLNTLKQMAKSRQQTGCY